MGNTTKPLEILDNTLLSNNKFAHILRLELRQEEPMTTFKQIAAQIDEHMTLDEKEFSGAILVARDGQPIIHKGYGQASIELHVPNTVQSVFRIASVTKQFTGIAVMMLQERGKLKVTDSICDHLTNCPETWKAISVHQLLVHTSGIPSYTATEENFRKTVWEPLEHEKSIDLFRNLPLESVPGEGFLYNNSGYYLLGVLIERLTGESYENFLEKNILGPLSMTNSGVDAGYRIIPNLATGYSRIDGMVTRNALTGFNAYSAGALFSTCEDLLKWDRALYSEKLVSKQSRDVMFTPFSSIGDEIGYGYGWYVGNFQGVRKVFHSGGTFGYRTYFTRFPEVDTTVIALSNNSATNLEKITQDLAAISLPTV